MERGAEGEHRIVLNQQQGARANPGDRIEAKISNEGQALSVTLIQ